MARPRKIIPDTVGINMVELASKILMMNDAEIGAWLRKAVGDCVRGCQDPDCDPFIRVQYERTVEEMQVRQDVNAQYYRRRVEKKRITDGVAATRDGADEHNRTGNRVLPESRPVPSTICSGKPVTISANGPSGLRATPSHGGSVATITTDAVTTTPEAPLSLPAGERGKRAQDVSLPAAAPAGSLSLFPAARDASAKRPYGTCGHVMLTDAEGRHLREVYGENLKVAIDMLDAYIENNGKMAKNYKNHAAVLRKGNWVWRELQKTLVEEKRLQNATRGPRNFKAEERERTARVLRGESADGKDYVRDEELTPAELEAKYG